MNDADTPIHSSEAVVDFTTCRALVVDDSERNHRIIRAFVESMGITQIEAAFDGVEGLEKVAAFSPDLVILDIKMPGMDGHDFLRRLRALPENADLPVLVVTAHDGREHRSAVFLEGATDFVSKPINGVEFVARAGVHLRNRLLMREQTLFRQRVSEELAMASRMQQELLPSAEILERAQNELGIGIEHHFEPSTELGGDLWGVRTLGDRRAAFYMVDFSGHGVAAALNTVRLHTLVDLVDAQTATEPARVLMHLNTALGGLLPRGQYATMLYGVLDIAEGSFTYSSAAAPDLITGDAKASSIERHAWNSLPLGIDPGARYETRSLNVAAGHFLFFHSDALSEMPSADGDVLEEEGVLKLVRQHGALIADGESPLGALVQEFRGDSPVDLDDDLTLLWLNVLG